LASTPANGLNGVQLDNPFDPGAVLGERDRTTTHSTTTGASLQATNSDTIFGHNNKFVLGGSFDSSVTRFSASAELGTIGSNFVVSGSGIFLGRSGDPVSIGPVALRTTNQYSGLYALDTFDVTNAFSITGGGRFNAARIALEDQIGSALNGNETFNRFNPIIGGTYKIIPGLTGYAGYSEANRAPTPLELSCADPAHPCIIAAFLISDPPLKQVVSRTVEAGLRGSKDLNIGTLGWKLGVFRADNKDDILAIPSPVLQGFGYFQNVGSTRRQGIESEITLRSSTLQLYASYALVDARFLDALQVGSNSPFAINGTSRSCRAIESRQSLAIESRPALIIRSPTRSRSEEMRCSSAVNTLWVTNPIRHRGCLPMQFSTCMHPINSTRHSRSTRVRTMSSITAMRPMEHSSIPALFPISPTAARHSPIPVH
jgi:outer membrane receptor protein involved in Fe transport